MSALAEIFLGIRMGLLENDLTARAIALPSKSSLLSPGQVLKYLS